MDGTGHTRTDAGPAGPAGRPSDAAAVVLAGGSSRRMGQPKSFLAVGGRELLQRALDAASGACPSVVLVGADTEACRRAALRYGWEPAREHGASSRPSPLFRRGATVLRVTTDRRPGKGPLAGLETGWAESGPTARWWALAADLPFASPSIGRRLLEELRAWEEGASAGAATGSGGTGGTDPVRGTAGGTGSAPAGGTRPVGRAVVPAVGGRPQPLCAAYGAGVPPIASRCLEGGIRAMGAFLDRLEVRVIKLEAEDEWRLFNVNTPDELEQARAWAEATEG